ncbi:MAG: RNA methyltransferase [Clostridia bacterium]|nr:RNA methyltransferase [Clostridia bacterium]
MERITSMKNPLVRAMKSLRGRKGREAEGRFLVEGEVMLREALKCGLTIRDLLVEEGRAAEAGPFEAAGARCFAVPVGVLEAVCDTRTPQGICASFDVPVPLPLSDAPARVVALDGTQDPGNVGTIWRTADAAGFQGLLFGTGCADPLSPKVQRSAMGSGFRVPFMVSDDLPAALMDLRERGWSVIASDLSGADFYRRPDPGEKYVLVIGNEARGICDAVRDAATTLVKLPMRGGAESLNAAVAAGIMMYEMMRQ